MYQHSLGSHSEVATQTWREWIQDSERLVDIESDGSVCSNIGYQ